MSRSRYVEIECSVVHTTDDAVLIDYEGEELWIPRSQIEDGEDVEAGDEDEEVVLNITSWIANERGIEVD